MGLVEQFEEQHRARLSRMSINGRKSNEIEVLAPHVYRRVMAARKIHERDSAARETLARNRAAQEARLRALVAEANAAIAQLKPLISALSEDEPLIVPPLPELPIIAIPHPRIKEVAEHVAAHYGISVLSLVSQRRTAKIVRPRQVTYYLCRELTPRSLTEIAKRMGNRDHTSILHGIRKISGLIECDTALAADIAAITENIQIELIHRNNELMEAAE